MSTLLFKDFGEITENDYRAIGFRAGLEIHQQLDTRQKLFCRCPAPHPPYDDFFHIEIARTLRPALSELGEIDPSILMEFKSQKKIIYKINRDTICTYELDQSPPFEINQDALDIAIYYCLKFNAKIVDEIYVCRKYHLDGSIPSGYQRTAMIGLQGFYEFKGKKIHFPEITLEEDAAREISDKYHIREYFTDRLGIPLIEIVTEPAFTSPQEVKEFAEAIRNEFLATGEVRKGSGTLRMDLNISINGSERCEIKGVDKISKIPILGYNEALRQWNLLRLRDALHSRNITPENFKATVYDLYNVLKHTIFYPIQQAIKNNGEVYCIKLPNWAGFLKWPTQRYTTFAQEISERVKVIACLTDYPNIIVSDIIDNTISREEIDKTKKFIGATSNDGFVIVWGPPEDVQIAIEEIKNRAYEATIGVPPESRRALPEGTTAFERVLPGPQRMYPDTDLPHINISKSRVERLRLRLKESYIDRVKWCEAFGFPPSAIKRICTSERYLLIKELVEKFRIHPNFIVRIFLEFLPFLEKRGLKTKVLTNEQIRTIFEMYSKGEVLRTGVFSALEFAMKGECDKIPSHLRPATNDELEQAYNQAVKFISQNRIYHNEKRAEILTGYIMRMLRGRVEGKTVKEFVAQKLEKENGSN
jgi:glutamyl-tRNA(Gln) amidotransferase subunit E